MVHARIVLRCCIVASPAGLSHTALGAQSILSGAIYSVDSPRSAFYLNSRHQGCMAASQSRRLCAGPPWRSAEGRVSGAQHDRPLQQQFCNVTQSCQATSLWCQAPPITNLGHSLWTGQGCTAAACLQCSVPSDHRVPCTVRSQGEGPAECTASSTVHHARSESCRMCRKPCPSPVCSQVTVNQQPLCRAQEPAHMTVTHQGFTPHC